MLSVSLNKPFPSFPFKVSSFTFLFEPLQCDEIKLIKIFNNTLHFYNPIISTRTMLTVKYCSGTLKRFHLGLTSGVGVESTTVLRNFFCEIKIKYLWGENKG